MLPDNSRNAKQLINQSIERSNEQTIKRSINQSINQSMCRSNGFVKKTLTNQSIKRSNERPVLQLLWQRLLPYIVIFIRVVIVLTALIKWRLGNIPRSRQRQTFGSRCSRHSGFFLDKRTATRSACGRRHFCSAQSDVVFSRRRNTTNVNEAAEQEYAEQLE